MMASRVEAQELSNLTFRARDQTIEARCDRILQQGEFVGEMIVKSGPVHRRGFRNILHRNILEVLRLQQLIESLLEQLPGAADSRIDCSQVAASISLLS